MFFSRLTDSILTSSSWRELCASLSAGKRVVCDGLWGSAATLVTAHLAQHFKQKSALLFVLAHGEQIEPARDDFDFWQAQLAFAQPVRGFPPLQSLETSLEERYTVGDEIFGERLSCLKFLLDAAQVTTPVKKTALKTAAAKKSPAKTLLAPDSIFVTSIAALMQGVPSPQQLRASTRILEVGKNDAAEKLMEWLLEAGWHRMPAVELPGEVAQRGHILDLYAPDWEYPLRVEFFGDEIESMRYFDIPTQRSIETVSRVTLTRLRESDVTKASLFDYLPPDILPIVIEPSEVMAAGNLYRDRIIPTTVAHSNLGNLAAQRGGVMVEGEASSPPRLGDAARFLHSPREVMQLLMTREVPLVSMSSLAQGSDGALTSWSVGSVERLCGNTETVHAALENLETGEMAIVTPTTAEGERLSQLWSATPLAKNHNLHFITGRLAQGFHWTFSEQRIIGSPQLFAQREIRRVKRRHLGQAIDSFLDLKNGDLVVHLAHGIGRYRGLQTMTKDRQEEDHLVLEFANQALIYVPVSKIPLVQKYVGGGKSTPALAKLGGTQWSRQKKLVQEAIFDMAAEMLELQAQRATREGVMFPADSAWQQQFDATFPYSETEDQLDAIAAIKNDMMSSRPMDRLLCGDVGFGKTEVALRGAFKAIDAGYQVAVLVPTTVLAEQHYRTFCERLREFPFTVAALSRFQNPKEQATILHDLSLGKIDLVVGTHRLTSKDVKFQNLGLLVIDEEQRFGVAAKEKLKSLRSTVDVLTMTATPIPRTLHFSLLGIRDISNLESPPADRLAVETKLVRFQDELVRGAILRELDRGGQLFFVHNRVADIELVSQRLQRICPEARLEIGHAQMPDGELEKVMRAFVRHEFDLLVCTTIVESGLDIPRANTIFIDEADHYGLAELHQLRGRVGRAQHQAYCYLLLAQTQSLTDVAAKRLRAIEEFSYLGAGFQLAMRDLEIRGAGNILGTQQSGHIALIGYELYCQLLEAAIRVLQQLPPKKNIEMEIDLPGRALLPASYIASQRMRIDIYRRLTRVSTMEEWQLLYAEVGDRFGKPPREVKRLFEHSEIRARGARWTLRSVRLEKSVAGDLAGARGGGYLVCEYTSRREMETWQKKLRPHDLRITDEGKAYLPLPPELGGLTGDADRILQFIIDAVKAY